MPEQSTRGQIAKALFDEHLETIRVALWRAAARRLPEREVEDFVSWGLLKIIESDYRCLRKYRGNSRLVTFLATVAARMAIDYYRRLRGVWRPSAEARRHGEVGIALDRLMHRDQIGLRAAVIELRQRQRVAASTSRLHEIAAALPRRADRMSEVPADGIEVLSEARASDRVMCTERQGSLQRVTAVVRECVADLSPDDRRLLVARFVERRTIASLADELGVPAKGLYRRVQNCLARVRRRALERGLSGEEIRAALDALGEASVHLLTASQLSAEVAN